jgi:hypothetical protein
MAKSKTLNSWLQSTVVRVTRIHFLFIAAYMASIIAFDSWNLFTHADIGNRWTAAAILLIINTVCWYIARIKFSTETIYLILIIAIVLADIVFAATNVYWERGLASKSVILFAVPIITSAATRSRSTILLSSAAYSTSAIRYFNLHYGESFRIELYGYVGLFCAVFFILAALLLVIVQPRDRL